MRLRDQHRERESRGEGGRRLGESGCRGEGKSGVTKDGNFYPKPDG